MTKERLLSKIKSYASAYVDYICDREDREIFTNRVEEEWKVIEEEIDKLHKELNK
jgi:hypothetical protein